MSLELVNIGSDKFREECGLLGVWGHPEAANLTYLGLYAQQHRGQEGVGIVSIDPTAGDAHPGPKRASDAPSNGGFAVHKGTSLVADVFKGFDFKKLPGSVAIGHVRYTTAGGNSLANVQPFVAQVSLGKVAIAHNGNLINADQLRHSLIKDGAIFGSSSDTEAILHLIARAPKSISVEEAVIRALEKVQGAYSLLIAFRDRIFAVRDPAGLRPLAIGKLDGATVFASETCAFDLIGAEYERDVEPGELVIVSDKEVKSYFPFPRAQPSPCVFEYVYFARPDSNIFKKNVYPIRKQMGIELARESGVDADMVVPVPDSGVTAAIGYSQEARIPLELGLIRNHYVGRTFIEPQQSIRDFGVKIKLNANAAVFSGKRIIVVDDSIVRGTTSRKLIDMFRRAGAKEVHLRISAPPTSDPCYYGIDTPRKEELIASKKTVEEIREYLNVDSLAYLSLEGLYRAVGSEPGTMCDACFSGNYPLGTPEKPGGPAQEELFGESS
ncbi:MAG: amidophosphoribosyltransferase [Bdellovibrionales bacterium]|nr:amidophosphoribosyltransferase [Bdellovibrionales bacterium]